VVGRGSSRHAKRIGKRAMLGQTARNLLHLGKVDRRVHSEKHDSSHVDNKSQDEQKTKDMCKF